MRVGSDFQRPGEDGRRNPQTARRNPKIFYENEHQGPRCAQAYQRKQALRTQGVMSGAFPVEVPGGGGPCQLVWGRVPPTSTAGGRQVRTIQAQTLQSRHLSRNGSSSPHCLSEHAAPTASSLARACYDTCVQGQWMMNGGVDTGRACPLSAARQAPCVGALGRPGQDPTSWLPSSSRPVHCGLWDTRISE